MRQKQKSPSMHSLWFLLVLALVVLGLLGFLGYGVIFQNSLPFWVGVNGFTYKSVDIPPKTLWDVLKLLILPVVLAIGGFLLSLAQKETERERTEERARLERALQEERNQEAILEAYLDRVSELMLDKGLCKPDQDSPIREIARARTRTVLHRLSGKRKGTIVRFLKEASLIDRDQPVILLTGADLRKASLGRASLGKTNLVRVNLSSAYLERAILSAANLARANLSGADLSSAQLSETILSRANLRSSDLTQANLSKADLIRADLVGANLCRANLSNAKLNGADLQDADLRGAKLGEAELSGTRLGGAKYDSKTEWSQGFDLAGSGVVLCQ